MLYYSHQCPFTAKYVPILENEAKSKGIPFQAIRFEASQQAQNSHVLFTTYSLFCNGDFITNEILSDKKFQKIIAAKVPSLQ